MTHRIAVVVLTVLAVVGSGPAVALTGLAGQGPTDGAAALAASDHAANATVNVTPGQQLATVLAVTTDEVRTDYEDTAFEVEYESADGDSRAQALAERAEDLRERSADVNEEYREATAEFQEGDLSRSAYARKLAELNARAENVLAGYDRLQRRAGDDAALELDAAGVNRTALRRSMESLDALRGAGPEALLERFTGRSTGSLELRVDGGLSVEADSEDGERSREIRRPRDADRSITVEQSAALETARGALSEGPWVLNSVRVREYDGGYGFRFGFVDNGTVGEAKVRVDGSTGEVYRIEEEFERTDDDEGDESEDSDRGPDGDIALVVAEGTPGPNETVTLVALADSEPVSNVTVTLDGQVVGETDADGRLTVTLPRDGGKLRVRSGEREGELEFEFAHETRGGDRRVDASGTVEGDTASVRVTYAGSPVNNATVYRDGVAVGTTDADGRVSVPAPDDDELELELVRGAVKISLEFAVGDGTLTLVEGEYEREDGEREAEDEREDEQREDERDTDDDGDDERADERDPTDTPEDDG